MAKAAVKPVAAASGAAPAASTVAVIGGGLAGMTAALRLAESGFAVTVFEANPYLGGNLSSETVNGIDHDVYPHMFCDWYANFWSIFENDLGMSREAHFAPQAGVKLMHKDGKCIDLYGGSTTEQAVANLRSGMLSIPEMFLLGFSMLDLASHPFNRTKNDEIDRIDVNGFIYSRGYSTNAVAEMHNYVLMLIWSIQSDLTAAASYQDFIKHTISYPREEPFSWLLKGSQTRTVIAPWQAKLEGFGCDVRTGTKVVRLELVDDKPRVHFAAKVPAAGAPEQSADFDFAVMAVPAAVLSDLVLHGPVGARIVDRRKHLAELRRFQNAAIPVVNIYFNKLLADIPTGQVGLADSKFELSFLDISQLWTDDPNMQGVTVLTLAASDAAAFPTVDPNEQAMLMITELRAFLPGFEPGTFWGDPASDIDWAKTYFRTNTGNKLFINDVGSFEWQPEAAYPNELPTVFFAGDFCRTNIAMATVEAAVMSGMIAAQALQAQDAAVTGTMRGAPIAGHGHVIYSDAAFQATKLAMLPFAYAATAWAAYLDSRRDPAKSPMASDAYSSSTYALLLPLVFTLDWWKTAYWLAKSVTTPIDDDNATSGSKTFMGDTDTVIGLGAQTLAVASDVLRFVAAQLPSRGDAKPASGLMAALGGLAGPALKVAQAAVAAAQSAAGGEPDPAPRSRRWRVKP